MLTNEQKLQFSEILDELGENLDISETQFDAAVKSYNAVGGWLANDDSLLKPYSPTVQPQGSMIIGTTIKPVHKDDDVDIDLVCELSGKNPIWTQKDLKTIVRDQLLKHKTYESLLDKEGRRCWTLKYREGSEQKDKYHMDILPAIIKNGYKLVFEKAFSNGEVSNTESLALSITDNTLLNYGTETVSENWLKSNPFGYAKWFISQATISTTKLFSLNEAVKPVPKYQKNKFPLQRVVQILKRHRDLMYDGDKEKPISVIITTLAGYAYRKEVNVFDALVNVIDNMHLYIETRIDRVTGKSFKFIGNPVNTAENFADRWRESPAKEKNFFDWLEAVKRDITDSSLQKGNHNIMERLSKSFGEDEVRATFSNIGNNRKLMTEQGQTRFDTKLGIVAGAANIIKPHTFYGAEE
jgi:ribosomal protein S7